MLLNGIYEKSGRYIWPTRSAIRIREALPEDYLLSQPTKNADSQTPEVALESLSLNSCKLRTRLMDLMLANGTTASALLRSSAGQS